MCLSNAENLIDKYAQLLKTHDWFYDYADDHAIWERGNRERAELHQMYKAFDPSDAKRMWNQYAPAAHAIK